MPYEPLKIVALNQNKASEKKLYLIRRQSRKAKRAQA